jgi:hypothetical protein
LVAAMLDPTQPTSLTQKSTAGLSAPRARAFSKSEIASLFTLLLAIASIPIVLNPLPPIADYVNHLARMQIIATINSDSYLHHYYEIDWQVIPNLMMDLIVPLFVRVMNVYLAGQLYTLMSFALILSGTMALQRQLSGRWSALPLLAATLLYNDMFLVGTMNYVFGIGLTLWALVTWISLRERGRALRLLVSALFVFGLFFCHLFALGVYGVGLLAFEADRLWTAYRRARRYDGEKAAGRPLAELFIDFIITGLPFVPVIGLLMLSPTRGLWDFDWQIDGKMDGLIFVVRVYSDAIAVLLAAVIVLAARWALRRRLLSFHGFGLALLAIGAAVYLALPRVMFETDMVDQRLPISLAFVLIACLDVDFRQTAARRVFVTGIVLLLTVRAGEVEWKWSQLSGPIQSFRQSVQLLNRGARVLVAYGSPNGGGQLRDYGLLHADCIAIIERSALVTTAFTVVGKQVLHVRAVYRDRVDTEDGAPPVVNSLVQVADRADANAGDYWRHWTQDYDYLYVLFTTPDFANPDPAQLTELFAGDRFILYRIERSQIAGPSKVVTAAGKDVK